MFGLFRIFIHSLPLSKDHVFRAINGREKVNLEGFLVSPPQHERDKTRFVLEAKKIYSKQGTKNVHGRVKITVYQPFLGLRYKDKVLIKKIRLHPPIGFRNFKGFDYQKYMQRKNIYVVGGVSKGTRIEILERGKSGIINVLFDLKEKILKDFDFLLPSPSNQIIKAMVFGERGRLDKEIMGIFNNSGVAHLLAISGLHLGFIAFASFFFIYKLIFYLQYLVFPRGITYFDSRKIAAFITLFPILLYTIMVGSRMPTLRAGIMIYTYLFAIILDRHRNLYNVLALAALIILIGYPLSLFDIGFQLSFTAVFVIILVTSSLLNKENDERPEELNHYFLLKKKAFGYGVVCLAASLSVLPIIALYFNRLIFISPVSNIAVLPFASLLIPLTLFSSVLGLISTSLLELFSGLINILTSIVFYLAQFFSSLPFSTILVPKPSLPILLLYYSGFLILLFNRKRQFKSLFIASCPLLISMFFIINPISRSGSNLVATFLDVGQGEATFIKTPSGQNILIDGGGTYKKGFDIGERVVLPFLLNHGVRKIDVIIATHPHPDHMRGLVDIVKALQVDKLFLNKDNPDYDFYRELKNTALKKGTRIKRVASPSHYEIGEVRIIFFHPSDEFNQMNSKVVDENNRSLVFKLVYKKFSVLFVSDIQREAEDHLLKANYPLKANILKVPHHGSKTSSTDSFLRNVAPDIAVISVGQNNWFGFPSQEVIKRLKEMNTDIYQTSKHGSIQLISNGNDYSAVTFSDLNRNKF